MSSPYSGATPAGSPPGYADPTQQNYAADYSGSMGAPTTEAGRPDVEGVSVGQLIGEVSKDLSTLMRQELELAKVEVKAEAKKAGQGAGLFGAAGFAGYMVLMFLSFALWWFLANVMDIGLAALIVAILWGIGGAVAYVHGQEEVPAGQPQARAHRRDPPAGSRRPQAQLTPQTSRSRSHDQQ